MKLAIVAVCLFMLSVAANAQNVSTARFPWEDIDKRIQASSKVAPLGPDLMGDRVSLSNGALSFFATDVTLPGNGALPVEFSRSYSVINRKDYPVIREEMFADWQIEAPNIHGVFVPDWPGNRCTHMYPPQAPFHFDQSEFWEGVQIEIPGGGELLRASSALSQPTNGTTYLLATLGDVRVSCLSSIKNGSGEGFLAVTPDGTRYWFDWMAQNKEAQLRKIIGFDNLTGNPIHVLLPRKRNALYATRIEDRFGNYVEYTYTNAWNAPAKLTQIAANDGRQINVAYSGGYVSSVSDGQRSWQYTYGGGQAKSLNKVTLPDASGWDIGFGQFTGAEIYYPEPTFEPGPQDPQGNPIGQPMVPTEIFRTCTTTEQAPAIGSLANPQYEIAGTLKHPSGAVATFTVDLREHGRSSVPASCSNVTWYGPTPGIGNDPNDDINLWAISGFSLTLKSKSITGPGLGTQTWSYGYVPNISVYLYPGTTLLYPHCPYGTFEACVAPPCTSDACAQSSITTVTGPGNEWTRYSYGNTYRYNEGKLLKEEKGTGPDSILRTTAHTYDLSQINQAYLAKYGDSSQLNGGGFQGEFPRPLKRTAIVQDGTAFIWQVDSNCAPGGTSLCFDGFARPTKVTRSSAPSP